MSFSPHAQFTSFPTCEGILQGFPELKAVCFDMDGTLFNTEPYHTMAFLMIGQEYKVRPPHSPDVVHHMLMGKADHLVYDVVKDWEGFPKHWDVDQFVQAKNDRLLNILSQLSPETFFPTELKRFIGDGKKRGLRLGLVTSSEKVITEKLLQMADIRNFDLVLTRDDCPKHKPDPWPYVEAMRTFSVSGHEMGIFEDSQVGLSAAHSSGARVFQAKWFS